MCGNCLACILICRKKSLKIARKSPGINLLELLIHYRLKKIFVFN